jgi:alpha-glucosidase
MPIQRSLANNYAFNSKIYDGLYFNQYLFGPSFLVCPVDSTKELLKIYLPEGEWYYLYNGQRYSGDAEIIMECPLDKLPVFVKAGALVPMQNASSRVDDNDDLLMLHVYAGSESSSFTYYTDDGESFDYQKEKFHKRLIDFIPSQKTLKIHKATGEFKTSTKKLKIVFHHLSDLGAAILINGSQHPLDSEDCRFFAPLEKFDPFYDPTPEPAEQVRSVTLNYSDSEFDISW